MCSDLQTAAPVPANQGSCRLEALQAAIDEILAPLRFQVTYALEGVHAMSDTC